MQIALIPGDGIGPEVTTAAMAVVAAVTQASGRRVAIETLPWGADRRASAEATIRAALGPG